MSKESNLKWVNIKDLKAGDMVMNEAGTKFQLFKHQTSLYYLDKVSEDAMLRPIYLKEMNDGTVPGIYKVNIVLPCLLNFTPILSFRLCMNEEDFIATIVTNRESMSAVGRRVNFTTFYQIFVALLNQANIKHTLPQHQYIGSTLQFQKALVQFADDKIVKLNITIDNPNDGPWMATIVRTNTPWLINIR